MDVKVKRAPTLRIGDLARRTGASARSLRHYEACGLLASHRLPNGYRAYPETAIETVRRIRLLLDAGLNLELAAVALPCLDADDGSLEMCPRVTRALDVVTDRLALERTVLGQREAALERLRGATTGS